MSELKGFLAPKTPSGKSAIIPEMPWLYSGTLLTVEYLTDPKNVAALLPEGVEIADEQPGAVAIIWADWQSCSTSKAELLDPVRSQYLETFVVIRCKYQDVTYSRCVAIWVTKDFAIARGWFQGYPKSKGTVEDKLATMSKYKYALVIENSPEYMSEKLMEALFAGCIPIYVGPDPHDYGIPKNLVIWTRPTVRAIETSLFEAASWNFDEFHSRLNTFLMTSTTRELWDHERVYQRILDIIQGKR
jgi:hypothetical protein